MKEKEEYTAKEILDFWGYFILRFPKIAMFQIIHTPCLLSLVHLLNNQIANYLFFRLFLDDLSNVPNLRERSCWNICPNLFAKASVWVRLVGF